METLNTNGTTADLTSLTNGTAYQVRVAAVNRSGTGSWSDTATKTPADEPDAPGAPTVTVWNQSLRVSWTAPTDNGASISDYDVQYRACSATDGDTTVLTCATNPTWGDWTDRTGETTSDTSTSATVTGLTNETAYQVQVRAANSVGESSWSTASARATPTPQKPDAPGAPTLTYSNTSLSVSWSAPANNGASISDYDVQYRACTLSTDLTCSNSSTATWGDWTDRTGETASDTSRSVTLSGLTNGTAYQVQVRAANSVGESDWSTSADEYPSTTPGKPAAPTLSVKDQSLGVSWSAPSSDGGAAITGYKVGRCSTSCASDSSWTVKTLNATGTTTDLTSLTNGTSYQVRVAAVNRSGTGSWSDPATKTPADEPDTPGAPTVTVWNKQLTVSWSAPTDNGASISDYDVQYRACTATGGDSSVLTCATNPTWGNWTDRTGETTSDLTTSVTLSGLTNDTAYQVQVRAANSVGESTWSTATKATPTAQKPDQPGAPTLTYGNASLTVAWNAPTNNGAAISDYDVQYRACTLSTDLTCSNTNTATWESTWTARTGETNSDTTRSVTLSGLTNGTAYQVQVRAANSVGESDWSTSADEYPSTTPGKPAAPTLTVKDQSLGVSWSAPTSNGGAAITGYKVGRCSTGCGTDSNWTVATPTGTGTTHDLTGLTNGTAYQVRVAAVNRAGDSAWSDTATETPADEPDAPGAPTVTVWNQSLRVSWAAPTDNGAAISDYDVQYRACTATNNDTTVLTCATNPTWGDWTDRTGETTSDTSTSVTISSLTNETAYQVQIRAANSVGESSWSTATKATPTPQKPDAPGAPTLTYSNTSLGVSWSAPANNGASITDYDVQYRACTLSTDLTCSNSSTATWESTWTDRTGETTSDTSRSVTLAGLTNGTAYQVQVRAANSVGESDWSTAASEYPSTAPGKPAAPTLTVKDQGLGVSWSAPSSTGGAAITGYKVGRCSTGCSSDASWTVKTLNTNGTTTDLTSLTNGTAYQVRVAALNRSGTGSWSDTATETPADEPDAPGAPTLAVWNKQLTVSWTAPTDNGASISDYDVQYRACTATNNDTTVLTCATNPTWGDWTDRTGETTSDLTTSATLTGLTNDTAYQVQVRAANSVGESSWSTASKATPTAQKPEAPGAPTLTYSNTSLGVSWSEPTNNGASITDYDVQYRACTLSTDLTCSDSNTATWESTWTDRTGETTSDTSRSVTLGGLTNGTAYQVQVRAANSVGESDWSTAADEFPSTVPGKPATPTLTVKDVSLGVSWSAPSSNGGAAITGYKVGRCSASCSSDANWTVKTLTTTGTTTDLTSLTNGTAYQVRVAAVNRSGTGAWSDTTTATPAKVPDAPSAPKLTKGARQLSVSWSAPADNGEDITDYDVRYCVNSTGCDAASEWTSLSGAADPGTSTTATISNLTNGTTYQVQVRATNSVGDGSWSPSSSAAPEDKPAQPATPTLTYSNTSLGVSWTAPADNGQDISDYDVQYRACTLSTDLTCADSNTATWESTWTDRTGETNSDTSTSVTLSSLTNGTAYQVQVRAANSVGESDWSTAADEYPSTVPGKPAAPSLTVKDQSLGVSWSPPSSDGGAAVTGYKVGRCYTGCGTDSNWTVKTLNTNGTTTDVTGLTNGTAYQVRVAAVNRSGTGSWSDTATKTPADEPDAPGAPTVTAEHQGLGVAWTAPTDNGASISDYDVQYRACTATPKTCTTSPTWGNWTDRSGETNSDTSTSVTLSSLTNGTAYQVQVRAGNSVGESAWSVSTKATPATQVPDAPAAPTVTARHQGLAVSWTEPSSEGSAITDYDVQYRACTYSTDLTCSDSNTATWESTWTARTGETTSDTTTSVTLGSLTNGTAYQVQVRAANGIGESTWSASTGGTPAIQSPDAPATPTLTHGDTSLSVSWTAPAENGSSIRDYDVRYRACTLATDLTCSNNSTATWGDWTDRTGETATDTTASATLSNLTNGTAYQVQVRAANSVGESTWSPSATETPSTKPEKPVVTLSGVAGSPTVTRISWTVDDGGAPITGYEIDYRCHPGEGWAGGRPGAEEWTVAAGTTHRDSSIPECASKLSTTEYRFIVRAKNKNGTTGAYPFAKTTTPSVSASAITIGPATTQMTVSWTASDGGLEISDHDVRYRQKDTNSGTPGDQPGSWTTLTSTDDPGTSTTATITGLTAGTTYQVQVRATNAMGTGSWSDSVNWPLRPTTPAPTVTARHLGLEVSWTAPAHNGTAITDYDVQYRKCTASADECGRNPTWGPWTDRTGETTSDTATTATISGLTNGIPYQVQVRATNIVGDSAWSAAVQVVPANQPPDAPAAPTLTISQTSLGVSWTEPATNGQPITDYDVQYRACTLATDLACSNTSTATWGAWTDRTGETASDTATTATISGLTKATAYQVRVRAANAIGEGGWSASTTGIPAVVPAAPAGPTLTVKHQSLGVSWSAPADDGGSAVTDYDVQYRACTATPLTCATSPTWGSWTTLTGAADPGATTSATITGLTNATAYQVQVRASNPAGSGAWSSSAAAIPAPQKPDAPAAPTLTARHQGLAVSWTPPAANGHAISDYDVQYRACTATPLSCATSPTWAAGRRSRATPTPAPRPAPPSRG